MVEATFEAAFPICPTTLPWADLRHAAVSRPLVGGAQANWRPTASRQIQQ